MKRWFMAYVQVYNRGNFNHHVYQGEEHPVAKVARWDREYGAKDGFRVVLLSFQEVGPEVPEADVVSAMLPA